MDIMIYYVYKTFTINCDANIADDLKMAGNGRLLPQAELKDFLVQSSCALGLFFSFISLIFV